METNGVAVLEEDTKGLPVQTETYKPSLKERLEAQIQIEGHRASGLLTVASVIERVVDEAKDSLVQERPAIRDRVLRQLGVTKENPLPDQLINGVLDQVVALASEAGLDVIASRGRSARNQANKLRGACEARQEILSTLDPEVSA